MKIKKSQLKQIIVESINELGMAGFGGIAGALGAVAGRAAPPIEGDATAITQEKAVEFFMDLGLDQKVSETFVKNMATSDLKAIMIAVPKIDTANEDDDELQEVSSEKQRRWACAQKDKAASERADSLSAAEAEEMCTSKVEEDCDDTDKEESGRPRHWSDK